MKLEHEILRIIAFVCLTINDKVRSTHSGTHRDTYRP